MSVVGVEVVQQTMVPDEVTKGLSVREQTLAGSHVTAVRTLRLYRSQILKLLKLPSDIIVDLQ